MVLSSFNKSAKAYITEDKKSGQWKTGTYTENVKGILPEWCLSGFPAWVMRKYWVTKKQTAKWDWTRVNLRCCHPFLCSPVILNLFSLFCGYRMNSLKCSHKCFVAKEKYICSVKFRGLFFIYYIFLIYYLPILGFDLTIMFAHINCGQCTG